MSRIFRAAALLLAVASFFPFAASAQNTYDVYIDTIGAAGCDVVLPGGTFAGADRRLQVTATSGASPQVTSVTFATCNAGTFGPGVPAGGGYPVGLNNGVGGSDVIELSIAVAGAFQGATSARFGFAAIGPGGSDVLFTANGQVGGGTIGTQVFYSIPMLGIGGLLLLAALMLLVAKRAGRHRLTLRLIAVGLLLTSGIALAANFVVDGQVGDWTGEPADAIDPAGDATNGAANLDLRAGFIAVENGNVFFRIDLSDLQNQSPIATPQAVTTNEDTAVTITLASTDPENDPRTYAIVTPPTNGTLGAITQVPPASATVQYTPNANFNGTDTFTFRATDSQGAVSAPATVTITVTPVNDAPVLTAGGTLAYTENAAATAIDTTITVSDIDSANLASATAQITAGYVNGEDLLACGACGAIVPAFNAATGTLTLTGAATLAQYQAALRSVTYANSSNNPTTAVRTVTWIGNDGGAAPNTSAPVTSTINVTAVNDAPVLTAGATLAYTENQAATAIDATVTVTDSDSANLASATVSITAGFQNGADVLACGTCGAIVPTYAAATGVLTLTGSATLAQYQAALRSVTYNNSSDNPTTTARTITWVGNDGTTSSAPVTSTVNITAVNDAPVLTAGGTLNYNENQLPAAIDATITVTDVDNTNLASASASITGGFQTGQDVLACGACGAIVPAYNAGTGVLTLTGSATLAAYQAALRSVTYFNSSENPGTAPRTITWVGNDGTASSAPVTSTVNVAAVNDPPLLTAGATAAYTENTAAVVIDNTITVSDVDNANLASATVAIAAGYQSGADTLACPGACGGLVAGFNAGTGTLTLTGSATLAVYQATLRTVTFVNSSDNPSTAPRTISWIGNDGTTPSAPVTSTVTITPVDDAPVAVNDAATVSEDSGANAIAVLTNDTDVDAGPISITSVTQPANGTVVITGGGTGLTYAPNLNFCDVAPPGPPDTFTYTLTPGGSTATVSVTVNCVDDAPVAVNDTATVTQNTGANAIAVLANDTDVDGGPIAIGSVTQPANGTVVITGGGTGLTYQPNAGYCNTPPGTTPDTFTYSLAPGGSTATVSVAVLCDIPPTAVNDAATVSEDSGANAINVLANDTDPDGGPISITSVTQPANGTVVITGGGTGLTYQPNANFCDVPPPGPADTFTYTLSPGGSTATVSVTVTCVDDGPVAVNDAATVAEDSGATAVPVLANDTDIDGGPISITSVTQPANGTVVITGGGTGLTYAPNLNFCDVPPPGPADTFTYTLTPGGSTATVSMTVTCVNDPPLANAQSVTTNEDTPIAITLTGTDVDAGATLTFAIGTGPTQGSLGPITPLTATSASVNYSPDLNTNGSDSFTFTVNDGTATSAPATVSITITPVDDPPVAVNDAATVLEDSGATAVLVLANDTDIDAGPISITSVTQPANGTVVITGGGTGLTYAPNLNYCNNPPPAAPDTFTYTLTPGGSSATVSMTVTCVNDAPTVTPPAATFAVLGNVRIQVPGTSPNGLLTTVADVDGPAPITVQNATYTSAQGGNVTVNQATGAWTYNPAPGYEGPDSFTYNVCDAFAPPACSANATVNLNVTGMIWFVQTGAPICSVRANGCGRLTNPYSTLGAFQAENDNLNGGLNPGNGDNIFLFENATSYVGPVILLTDQKLIGQDASATLQSIAAVTVPAFSDALPAMATAAPATTITSATNAVAITNGAGNDNTIRGLTIGNVSATGTGINMNTGATTIGTLTIGNATTPDVIINTDGRAMNLQGGTLNANLISTTSTGGTGVQNLRLATIAGTQDLGTGALSGSTVTAVSITGTNTLTYAGSITNTAAADNMIDIQNHTTGTITLSGALTKTSGGANLMQLATDSGTYVFSGALNSTRGISVSNSSGTFTWSNASKVLNTGGATAVSSTNNAGATLAFTGGGLDIDTTTGVGFNATGAGPGAATGGTISVQGANNTIASISAAALNVVNTTIAAADLNFRSIASGNNTGAADGLNGIVLNNTGTLGGLTVTGDGTGAANASGGLVQRTTGTGIRLISTRDIVLNQLNIDTTGTGAPVTAGAEGHGIDADAVTNLTFQDASLINVGAGNEEHGVRILNLFGTGLFEDVLIDEIAEDGFQVRHNSATAGNLTFRRVNVQDHKAGFGEAGIEIQTDLAGALTVLLDDSDFAINTNAILGVQLSTASTYTGTVNFSVQATVFNAANAFGSGSIQVLGGGHGTQVVVINGNTINNTKFDGIRVNNDFGPGTAGGPSITRATITNNIIDGNGAGPPLNNGEAITLRQDGATAVTPPPGDGQLFALIQNNTITGFNSNQIHVQASDGATNASTAHATVLNNTGTIGAGAFGAGFLIDVGDGSGVAKNSACVDVSGNTLRGSNTTAFFDFDVTLQLNEAPGAGDANLRVRQTLAALSTANNAATVSAYEFNPPGPVNPITFNGGACTLP